MNISRSALTDASENYEIVDEDRVMMAPLPAGSYILFLRGSSQQSVYGVVGVSQGVLVLNSSGDVSAVSEAWFPSFIGMDVDAVQNVVNGAGN